MRAMRIAVTGANGRLGTALAAELAGKHEVVPLDRQALDLSEPRRLPGALDGVDFDVLVNSAAVTSPDAAEADPELARLVNAEAPGVLADCCRRRGARMVQVSTDYVFGGEKPGFLDENDPAEPVNVYGATKLAGERAVLEADPEAMVVRVCWLYGGDRPGFPDQIVQKALAGETLELIDDKFSLPTRVPDLAGWISGLLGHPEARGVIHACPSGPRASWRDWALAALEAATDAGILAQVPEVGRMHLDDCTFFRVPRPRHTVMDNARLSGILGVPPRPWREGIVSHFA